VLAVAIAPITPISADDAPNLSPAAKSWWSHVQYLADDQLQGRHTGTAGFELAAAYVEKQFREAGLQPAGTTGYRQDVSFNVVHMKENETRWDIVRDGKSVTVQLGTDGLVHAYTEGDGRVDAAAVFVGYGFAVPEKHFDELAGLDLRGKIAVSIGGRPGNI